MKDPYAHIPEKFKKGHCYTHAFEYILSNTNNNLRLCHGWVTGQMKPVAGIRYSHAWIEDVENRTIIDPSLNPKDPIVLPDFIYYFVGNINPQRICKYTVDEALEHANRTKKYGPWETKYDE